MNPRYKIDGELGKGGTSVVYQATDLMLNRVVALKVLNESLSRDALAVQRLRREAKTLCSLKHPNIVQIYAFELQEDGTPLMVMDIARGISLSKMLKQNGPLPEADAIKFYKQICTGLSYAHGLDVVHRDIKPSNIIATAGDGIKILDFGIAKFGVDWSEELSALTQSGQLFGTLSYMSPEQLSGDVDSRSDIYSLGCTMYELVAGQLPFKGDNALEIAHKILTQDIPTITTVSPGLAAIILKSMVRDRNHRYQTCDEVLEALETLQTPKPRTAGTNKGLQALGVSVLIALLAFTFQQFYLVHEKASSIQRSQDWDAYLKELENDKRVLWKAHVNQAIHLAEQAGYSDLRAIQTYVDHTDRLLQHPLTADSPLAAIQSSKALKLLEERKKHNLKTPDLLISRVYKARGDVLCWNSDFEQARKYYEWALPPALLASSSGTADLIATSLVDLHLKRSDAASAIEVFRSLQSHNFSGNFTAFFCQINLDYTNPNLPKIGRSLFALANGLDTLKQKEPATTFRKRLTIQNSLLPDEYRLPTN